jgi:hypothetical protein
MFNYPKLKSVDLFGSNIDPSNSSIFHSGLISELTSKKAAGRFVGYPGERFSAEVISSQLRALGLVTALPVDFPNVDGFLHKFKAQDFTSLERKSYIEFSYESNKFKLELRSKEAKFGPLGYNNPQNVHSLEQSEILVLSDLGNLYKRIEDPEFVSAVNHKWLLLPAEKFFAQKNAEESIKPIFLLALAELQPRGVILCGSSNVINERKEFVSAVMNAESAREDLPTLVYIPERMIQEQLLPLRYLIDCSERRKHSLSATKLYVSDVRISNPALIGNNVIAKIPKSTNIESDLGSLILGAHYDHIGRTNKGSTLFQGRIPKRKSAFAPGMNDNVSGVAVVIELARRLKNLEREGMELPRDVIIVAWSGEELDLQGSRNFLNDVRLYNEVSQLGKKFKIDHYFNFDMVANASSNLILKTSDKKYFDLIRLLLERQLKDSKTKLSEILSLDPRMHVFSDSDSFIDHNIASTLVSSKPTTTYHTLNDRFTEHQMRSLNFCANISEQIIKKVLF